MKQQTYEDFRLSRSPRDLTFFGAALQHQWERLARTHLMDWSGFEAFCRDVLGSPLVPDAHRLSLLREAVAAFTGRGPVEVPKKPERDWARERRDLESWP